MRSAKIKLQLDPQLPGLPKWFNPVVPGDHPDPTILRVGRTFWASATSGEWSPQFPLFRSTDLLHWEPAGAVFRHQPAWAEGSFWAPELVHDELSGQFIVWYVARKRGGNLCIAVASATSPTGPYLDHGPVVCEADGSIDPCFARDEHGEPYLIWKEDGNSQDRPTPIWAQALTEDLLELTGDKTQLIVNDQPWEEGVVEGPYILRREGRFYMFYAGNSCCGKECKYAEGVARADKLLGPWEKFPGNPLIAANDSWRCPGHGTAVRTSDSKDKPGQDYLLYHAYPAGGSIYVGREAVLDEITWTPPEQDGRPGWPVVNAGRGPGEVGPTALIDFVDDFEGQRLGHSWQWPVNTEPEVTVGNGLLTIAVPLQSPLAERAVESAMLAVPRPASTHFRATVKVIAGDARDRRLWAGLSIVGDPFNTVGLGVRGETLTLWERRGNTQRVIAETRTPADNELWIRSASSGTQHQLQFSFSGDGVRFEDFGAAYDASDLPAWDRGLRIGLMLEGPRGSSATFRNFELRAQA